MSMSLCLYVCMSHHLDTVSDPSTETNILSRQLNCLCTADDILVYPAQPFGTVCQIILETLLYLWAFFGAIQRLIYSHVTNVQRHTIDSVIVRALHIFIAIAIFAIPLSASIS